MVADVRADFAAVFGRPPEVIVRAPGRVDLIGAHVDYNDGPVLVVAIDRHVCLAAALSASDATNVVARDLGESVSFDAASVEHQVDRSGSPLAAWALYPAGVQWSVREAGHPAPALDVLFTGDLPIGAGLSSSAAVEVAFARCWSCVGEWRIPPLDLARLCRTAENEYVGVACGLMDQFASVFGKADTALLFDCRTLEWDEVPLVADAAVVVADTGSRRALSDGRLNERQAECQSALAMVREALPRSEAGRVRALRDLTPLQAGGAVVALPEPERSRAEHVVAECQRVWRTADALLVGDVQAAGVLLNESHESARDKFDVSGPELEAMWSAATAHPACLGGRSVGAGFAGCQVFLVVADEVHGFIRETARRYQGQTGLKSELFPIRAAAGASAMSA